MPRTIRTRPGKPDNPQGFLDGRFDFTVNLETMQIVLLIAILLICLMEVLFAFFIDSRDVLIQTIYGLTAIIIFVLAIINMELIQKFRWIRNLIMFYCLGQTILYLVKFFEHYFDDGTTVENYNNWMAHFNNYSFSIIIYTGSILLAVIWTIYTETD